MAGNHGNKTTLSLNGHKQSSKYPELCKPSSSTLITGKKLVKNSSVDYDDSDQNMDESDEAGPSGISITHNKTCEGIGLELRKTIMVGSDYQTTIPEGLSKYKGDELPYRDEDKLLWDPNVLSDKEVENYLSQVAEIHMSTATGVASIPRGAHVRDDEQALYELSQNGYNIKKALEERRRKSAIPQDTSSFWSEEECKNFESGVRLYGKDFFMIHTNKVRSRTIGELVQFYYLWKKTERHDIFANRSKLEKKKYSLHPGVTFLEDHDEGVLRDGSFPNIQCLIYGDSKKFHRSTDLAVHAYYDSPSERDSLYSDDNPLEGTSQMHM